MEIYAEAAFQPQSREEFVILDRLLRRAGRQPEYGDTVNPEFPIGQLAALYRATSIPSARRRYMRLAWRHSSRWHGPIQQRNESFADAIRRYGEALAQEFLETSPLIAMMNAGKP